MQTKTFDITRRSFLRRSGAALAAVTALDLGALGLAGCASAGGAKSGPPSGAEAGNLSWKTTLTAPGEPGEPMVVSGRIYGPDGRTPAAGATLYVYHTDARGLYSERDAVGGPPDPRINGRMKTGADGRYEFHSIKPASYPGTRNPAHIHAQVSGAGIAEQRIHEYWFEGDPFINADVRKRFEGLGTFSPVMPVKRGDDGVLRCVRDIKLERA
jgi:protocatechuate 3,4-dioxygenase, beta subunit